MTPFIRLHPADDVLIARSQLVGGTTIESIQVKGLIPPGHKVATRDIATGEPVSRYNQIIGFATKPIAAGDHVHTHNLGVGDNGGDFARDYAFGADVKPVPEKEGSHLPWASSAADGRVATRNYIGILSSVNCSATAARAIADHFSRQTNPAALADFPMVDGVVALTHGTGCGMDTEGMGMQILERTLAGYATHANFWGVLVVGLGCEANQINAWLAHSSLREGDTLKVFNIQDTGGTRKTVEKGIALIKEMLPRANDVKREPCSASHITIGLQCGGSDGYSGISANPALGAAVDLLVAHGGTAILSETPEVYGAEHLLTRRAVKKEVGEKLISRIKWWEDYTRINNGEMNNNPSPGNKAGGLTTILEKSLGAVAKGRHDQPGGRVRIRRTGNGAWLCVHGHAGLRPGQRHGPGGRRGQHDLLYHRARLGLWLRALAFAQAGHQQRAVAAAGGRHGHQLRRDHRRQGIHPGDGQRIFELVLATASGEPSKSESHGYGQNEFVPWQVGAVM
jgi:altronate hydrolase